MSNPPVTVRFAPSPTGRIHIGNARTAIFNWLFAKKQDGRFVLRFDDTDRARSKEEYARGIEADLNWLGIVPDAIERQSDRFDAYAAAAERLKAAGRLYACYETPDELDRKRKRRRARGLPPIYDRAGLRLTDAERAAFEAEGRKPHWRFLLSNYRTDPETFEPSPIVWDDLVRGHQSIDLGSLSDPVLVREDGTYLYTLPSVVDDIDMAISHVIRGDDHVANTAVQIDLFKALGGTPPAFAHHNLLTSATGEGLSKRIGSLSIKSMREDGFEPMAIVALAARIGTADAVEPVRTMAELVAGFDLARVSMSPARFDPADIGAMNARLLHDTPFTEVEARLAEIGVGGGEAFWLAVRGNVERLRDAAGWWQVVAGPIDPVIDPADRDFLAEALKLLPSEPWDGETWGAWTNALKKATGRKGRALFLPLRLALTGRDDGPELKALLPLIGHRNTTARLS